MISKFFSIRNYIMKQLMKPNKEGIMQVPDPGKVNFGEMLIKEELFHYFHLSEIDIERNYTPALLNIPNRVLSISDIMKKLLNFGLVKTFFMYRQQKRFGIVTKIKGLFRKAS